MTETEELELIVKSMCVQPGCYNLSARGVIYCEACLHGPPQRASDEQIAAKKRLMRLRNKAA